MDTFGLIYRHVPKLNIYFSECKAYTGYMKASKSPLRNPEYISTGMAPLDSIMGGGMAMGRVTHFSGAHSTGKTTTAYMLVANAQKAGKKVRWYDTEKRFEFDFAESLGVDLNQLDHEPMNIAEDIFDDMIKWCGEKNTVAVMDSVGGLHTKKEAEEGMKAGYPDAPKLLPLFMRTLVIPLYMNQSAALLLNHEKKTFDGILKIMGGEAIPYHSSTWVRFRRTGDKIMQGENEIASKIEAKIWKGKYFHQACTLMQKFTDGFDMELMLADNAIAKGIIRKDKNSYYLGEEKLCVGLGNLRDLFKDPEFAQKIKALIS